MQADRGIEREWYKTYMGISSKFLIVNEYET